MRLVLDWDGTVTETDSLWMALDRFGDPEVFARVEGALTEGRLSFREVMELEFATVTATVDEVAGHLLREVRIRPGFAELAAAEGPLVLSSGFHELIEPLLAREGVQLEVRANRLDPRPDGWRVLWRDPEPCPHCGDLCKRRTLPDGPLAYVGDGYSDRCAALVADRVFARDGLAEWLEREGVPFERFADFYDVAAALGGRARAGGADEPRARTTGRK
ncbi:MAG TPA: HAD-IB family phosphatase [Gaiellaceae bacterium]|nr:HAD-IB family phosphatase [Gaiellaceae bacterium]